MYICDKCGAHIDSGAKFCGQCGDPVTEADIPKKALSSNAIPLAVITFGYSSSANYPKAQKLCEHIPTYQVIGEGKQAEHQVTLEVTEIALIKKLYDLVGSWKSSQMLIGGKQCTKKDLTYYGLGCYQNRQQSSNPDNYCNEVTHWNDNIWGCLRMPTIDVEQLSWNLSVYGNLNKKGQWVLDQKRLQQDLMSSIKENELCPRLDREHIMSVFQKLPDYIDPKTDKRWQYETRQRYSENGYFDEIVGIKPAKKLPALSLLCAPTKQQVVSSDEITTFERQKVQQHSLPDRNSYYRPPKTQAKQKEKERHILVRVFSGLVKTVLVLFLILLIIAFFA